MPRRPYSLVISGNPFFISNSRSWRLGVVLIKDCYVMMAFSLLTMWCNCQVKHHLGVGLWISMKGAAGIPR